jgi:hypothetical protein
VRARLASAAVVGILALLLLPTGALADDGRGDDGGDIVVTIPEGSAGTEVVNAQLRWGINTESGAGAFAGGCNFLSAGRAGDSGGAREWKAGDGLYRATAGKVRIEKPDIDGAYDTASFATKCLDATGSPVSVSSLTSTSGNQVVIDGGTGRLVDGAGLEIRWRGSFTVAYYGGMTYWSVTDPVLTLDEDGDGSLVAQASGYAASMSDLGKWDPIAPRSIVLAELRDVDIAAAAGFAAQPRYLGVTALDAGQVARTSQNADYWGAFPASFVAFQKITGQVGYWVTTGGQRDRAKVPTPVYVSYDADDPVSPTAPGVDDDPDGDGDDPRNPVRPRPSETPASVVPAPPGPAAPELASFAAGDAVTLTPGGAGLVPEGAAGRMDPRVVPALGVIAALAVSALSVLHLTGTLGSTLGRVFGFGRVRPPGAG